MWIEKFQHKTSVFFVLPPAHPLFREGARLIATEFSTTAGTDPRDMTIHAYRWHLSAPVQFEADLAKFIEQTYFEELPVSFDGIPLYRAELHAALKNTSRMTTDLKDMADLKSQAERFERELARAKTELDAAHQKAERLEQEIRSKQPDRLRDLILARIFG